MGHINPQMMARAANAHCSTLQSRTKAVCATNSRTLVKCGFKSHGEVTALPTSCGSISCRNLQSTPVPFVLVARGAKRPRNDHLGGRAEVNSFTPRWTHQGEG